MKYVAASSVTLFLDLQTILPWRQRAEKATENWMFGYDWQHKQIQEYDNV